MTENDKADHGGDINLAEVAAIIKSAIPTAIALSLILGIAAFAYNQKVEKQYTAVASFIITDNSSQNRMPDLGGLSGILPVGSSANESERVSDKVRSRDFILSLFDKTPQDIIRESEELASAAQGLEAANTPDYEKSRTIETYSDPFLVINKDPFFTGESNDGMLEWIFRQVSALLPFLDSSEDPTEEDILAEIVENYREIVKVTVNANEVIELRVTYPLPSQAADLANMITLKHLNDLDYKQFNADRRQIRLMRASLTEAQQKLNAAMDAASAGAVVTSVRATEELGASSLRLNRFRREAESLNNVLLGIAFIEKSNSAQINLNTFAAQYPDAFTLLRREFDWPSSRQSVARPDRARLSSLKAPYFDRRNEVRLAIQQLEAEANMNAEAAGRQADLKREVESRSQIYARLLAQFESRTLVMSLNDDLGEWIQEASPPIRASAPRILARTALFGLLGIFLAVLGHLFQTIRRGTLHTPSGFLNVMGTTPVAENVGRAVGGNQKFNPKILTNRAAKSPELLEFVHTLRVEKTRGVLVLGAPYTPAVRNLALTIAVWMSGDDQNVAVVDLSKKIKSSNPVRSHGILQKISGPMGLARYEWQEAAKGNKDALSLDEALKQLGEQVEHMVVIGTSVDQGSLLNTIALQNTERTIVLCKKGSTRKASLARIKTMLGRKGGASLDLMLA